MLQEEGYMTPGGYWGGAAKVQSFFLYVSQKILRRSLTQGQLGNNLYFLCLVEWSCRVF